MVPGFADVVRVLVPQIPVAGNVHLVPTKRRVIGPVPAFGLAFVVGVGAEVPVTVEGRDADRLGKGLRQERWPKENADYDGKKFENRFQLIWFKKY